MRYIPAPIRNALIQLRAAPAWIQLAAGFAAIGTAFCVYFLFLYVKCFFIVEYHLHSNRWSIPATIYAQAPSLYPGLAWNPKDLTNYLERLDYHRYSSPDELRFGGEYLVDGSDVLFRNRKMFLTSPNTSVIRVKFGARNIESIWNRDTGEELTVCEMDPVPIKNLFDGDREKRTLVSYADLPPDLIRAVIAIEDRRFYSHQGVDPVAIVRALWSNITQNRISEGGSTITQQTAKNFYLTPERSLRRKMAEALMARILEIKLNKEQILEMYLNEIYLGQRGSVSINGVGEAARSYFRKDVQHIDVAEAALLAGMIQAPNLYNPYRHPEEAKKRRDVVLEAMMAMKLLTEKECQKYSNAALNVYAPDTRVNPAPYFSELVKTQLLENHDEKEITSSNLHIFTTLDLDLQEQAEAALITGLQEIDRKRFSETKKKVQGCLIAIEPRTGYIRALVGGRDYSKSQFNRVTQAFRQPGSVFKPVVYAAAIEQTFDQKSKKFSPATFVEDRPWIFRNASETWEPANYDGQFHGSVTLRSALAHSLNVATARLAVEVGLPKVVSLANQMGFDNTEPVPSLALGSLEASPWQVATAFIVFANRGVRMDPQTVYKIAASNGKTIEQNQAKGDQVLHPQTAFLVTDMLRSALIYGTGASISQYGFNLPAAGKTGTTDDYRDAWFAGYTPNLLCIVWVGYDDNTPVGMSGARAALPIWAHFMIEATKNLPAEDFPIAEGIITAVIDPLTGKLATQNCPQVVTEVFIRGTQPVEYCDHDFRMKPWIFGSEDMKTWKHHFRADAGGRGRGKWWNKFRRKMGGIFKTS